MRKKHQHFSWLAFSNLKQLHRDQRLQWRQSHWGWPGLWRWHWPHSALSPVGTLQKTKLWGLWRTASGILHGNSGKKTDMRKTKGKQENEKKVSKYPHRAKSSPDTDLKCPWHLQNCQFLSHTDIHFPLFAVFLKKILDKDFRNFHVQKMWNYLIPLIQSLHRGQWGREQLLKEDTYGCIC